MNSGRNFPSQNIENISVTNLENANAILVSLIQKVENNTLQFSVLEKLFLQAQKSGANISKSTFQKYKKLYKQHLQTNLDTQL